MSSKKISQLATASALTGAELTPIVQSGTTVSTTVQDIANLNATSSLVVTASATNNIIEFIKGDGSPFYVTINTGSAVLNLATGSLLVTASATNNTITFTKGDGTPFNVTIDTGSGIPGGSDTQIQFNSGGTFGASSLFKFIYDSGSLQLGSGIASGLISHAEGINTEAFGDASHAEGNNTLAFGDASHAEGNNTLAYSNWSHAEGLYTTASGNWSHTEGVQTISSASYQHVQGIANITSAITGAFIIGNGTVAPGGAVVLTRSNLLFAAENIVQITGSLNVSGSITGSLYGTSSWSDRLSTYDYYAKKLSVTSLTFDFATGSTLINEIGDDSGDGVNDIMWSMGTSGYITGSLSTGIFNPNKMIVTMPSTISGSGTVLFSCPNGNITIDNTKVYIAVTNATGSILTNSSWSSVVEIKIFK
jgi:hypothetical protein